MNTFQKLAISALAALALPSIALADAVIPKVSGSPEGNFGSPTAGANVGYTISVSNNGTSYIVVLSTTDAAALPFANLYFDTQADTPGTGSNLAFETTNYNAFIPTNGGPVNQTDLHSYAGYSAIVTDNGAGKTITVTIPNTFFIDDPLGLGFAKAVDGGDVSLHLSQTFSYTVVGGSTYFPVGAQLGETPVSNASPVPEPATIQYMLLSGAGLLSEVGRRRFKRRQA